MGFQTPPSLSSAVVRGPLGPSSHLALFLSPAPAQGCFGGQAKLDGRGQLQAGLEKCTQLKQCYIH